MSDLLGLPLSYPSLSVSSWPCDRPCSPVISPFLGSFIAQMGVGPDQGAQFSDSAIGCYSCLSTPWFYNSHPKVFSLSPYFPTLYSAPTLHWPSAFCFAFMQHVHSLMCLCSCSPICLECPLTSSSLYPDHSQILYHPVSDCFTPLSCQISLNSLTSHGIGSLDSSYFWWLTGFILIN